MTILLVEDNPADAEIMRELLYDHKELSFKIVCAGLSCQRSDRGNFLAANRGGIWCGKIKSLKLPLNESYMLISFFGQIRLSLQPCNIGHCFENVD